MKKILGMKPHFQEKHSWFHFHYTPACSAIIMQWLLTDSGLVEVSHPPYSLSLAPSDPFLSPKVETWLCRCKEEHNYQIKYHYLDTFSDCFVQPSERFTLKETKSIVLLFHVCVCVCVCYYRSKSKNFIVWPFISLVVKFCGCVLSETSATERTHIASCQYCCRTTWAGQLHAQDIS